MDTAGKTLYSINHWFYYLRWTPLTYSFDDRLERLEEANRNPEKHPDLIVRVTGFSAYFASLSPEMRQYVVDRVINGD